MMMTHTIPDTRSGIANLQRDPMITFHVIPAARRPQTQLAGAAPARILPGCRRRPIGLLGVAMLGAVDATDRPAPKAFPAPERGFPQSDFGGAPRMPAPRAADAIGESSRESALVVGVHGPSFDGSVNTNARVANSGASASSRGSRSRPRVGQRLPWRYIERNVKTADLTRGSESFRES